MTATAKVWLTRSPHRGLSPCFDGWAAKLLAASTTRRNHDVPLDYATESTTTATQLASICHHTHISFHTIPVDAFAILILSQVASPPPLLRHIQAKITIVESATMR